PCFFFSSRRRHTRFSRDWSSHVCSSDLTLRLLLSGQVRGEVEHLFRQDRLYPEWNVRDVDAELPERHGLLVGLPAQHVIGNALRSEERRVGKEGRSRRGA